MVRNQPEFVKYKYGHGECLNGISYLDGDNGIYLTGKRWPFIFKV